MRALRTLFATLALALLAAVPAGAVDVGEDGLHKPSWLNLTFKDMTDDLRTAQEQGKRMAVIFEQRGCIYCKKMHTEIFTDPEIRRMLEEDFFFVQMNLFGDEEVTDFDGTTLPEKKMARRWGVVFTPTIMFMPEEVPESGSAAENAVMTMPGAFGKGTTRAMLEWVERKLYEGDEHFQKYVARRLRERQEGQD
ncbi:MAG: thioredoxin family protein [Pseudomonadota bacterium]